MLSASIKVQEGNFNLGRKNARGGGAEQPHHAPREAQSEYAHAAAQTGRTLLVSSVHGCQTWASPVRSAQPEKSISADTAGQKAADRTTGVLNSVLTPFTKKNIFPFV